ncbi:putative ABC transport system permease protein [Candidatus Electrothrix aarhusensis]|uniref:Putative ABC transport system permease protein n=1 Tax=Candidatus Electrothrix aarhusensis TaxID=1859131 RepID=A0A3S3QGH2_9BACT|nr:putative ABC transport system permease protein [Candidatus Electrothrix aarhusensis]
MAIFNKPVSNKQGYKQGYQIRALLKTACLSLLQQKLRSLLSILGIVCGIMAVVAVIAIGEGAEQETMRHIKQMGITNIYIRADQLTEEQQQRAKQHHSAGLQNSDRERLRTNPFIRRTAGTRERTRNLTDLPQGLHPQLMECTASYGDILGIQMALGRFISETDTVRHHQVCVLGSQIAADMGRKGQLGQEIRIGEQLSLVVGILARQDGEDGQEELKTKQTKKTEITKVTKVTIQNLNNIIFFPLDTVAGKTEAITTTATTADPLTGQLPLTEILVEVKQADQVKPCAALLRRSLHKAHNGFDDFQLIIPLELLAQARKIQGIFNLVFAIIGAITLFVGGIGIMNIMLANISERIHEIGLRRAVGARPEHILIQFLGEAVLLTLIGGIIGILCGVLLASFLGRLTGWPIGFSLPVLLLPLAISVMTGLFFGIYPARKAAAMDPIQALGSPS